MSTGDAQPMLMRELLMRHTAEAWLLERRGAGRSTEII